jgi:hypothetical protein
MRLEDTELFKTLEPYQQRLSRRLPDRVKQELADRITIGKFSDAVVFSEYVFAVITAYFEDEIEEEVARDMGKKLPPRRVVADDEDFDIPLAADQVEYDEDGADVRHEDLIRPGRTPRGSSHLGVITTPPQGKEAPRRDASKRWQRL